MLKIMLRNDLAIAKKVTAESLATAWQQHIDNLVTYWNCLATALKKLLQQIVVDVVSNYFSKGTQLAGPLCIGNVWFWYPSIKSIFCVPVCENLNFTPGLAMRWWPPEGSRRHITPTLTARSTFSHLGNWDFVVFFLFNFVLRSARTSWNAFS